ncbi:hypothetical protein [Deinococcus maricopensis]|uniref:Cyclase dehydrase n=1 Tax=Deinococcus maricopensis (strain DSM 21211 / LMG 22137 / NRRL B-23946 / LB-34) TaxID=709986 RepID=E8U861_DEIML|nr:hypothetical protein [Deinococcus maricopensis]ADV67250.1 hypothetical protein Deima_1601 [Deinococcus maricopensis DSM 21211]
MNAPQVARALGWFSLGLGLAELIAPGKLDRALGLGGHTGLVRSYGVREIAAGAGLLLQPNPTPWLWSRVAGDVLDLASLGRADPHHPHQRYRLSRAIAAVTAITVVDVLTARALTPKPA